MKTNNSLKAKANLYHAKQAAGKTTCQQSTINQTTKQDGQIKYPQIEYRLLKKLLEIIRKRAITPVEIIALAQSFDANMFDGDMGKLGGWVDQFIDRNALKG